MHFDTEFFTKVYEMDLVNLPPIVSDNRIKYPEMDFHMKSVVIRSVILISSSASAHLVK